MKNVRVDVIGALEAGIKESAPEFILNFGIQYQKSVPQTMADCWEFWNCSGITENLPSFVMVYETRDPYGSIGYGLSQQDADDIHAQQLKEKSDAGVSIFQAESHL